MTVPAGTFTGCLKVRSVNELGNYTWFAPRVGLIKAVARLPQAAGQSTASEYVLELQTFAR